MAALFCALLVTRGARGVRVPPPETSEPVWNVEEAGRLLWAAFLAGGALLALEVVWFRFLLLFVYGNSLGFAVMLSVVLLGIGLGAVLAGVWLGRVPGAHRHTSLVAIAAGIAVAYSYVFFDAFSLYAASPIRPVQNPWLVFGMAAGLAGPVSLLSGVLYTFLGRSLRDLVSDETKVTAAVTFANTIGAMLGSALAGFILIPTLGVEKALFLLALAYGAIAFLALRAGVFDGQRSPAEVTGLRVAGVLAVLLFAFFPFGRFREHYLPLVVWPHTLDGSKQVALREGPTETAVYLRNDFFEEPRYFRLITDGYAMSASTLRSKRYMSLFAYWPAAFHTAPRKALLISYGVGITAKALTEIEELESIDVVDISKNVVELSREVGIFPEEHPLDDPRVAVHIEELVGATPNGSRPRGHRSGVTGATPCHFHWRCELSRILGR